MDCDKKLFIPTPVPEAMLDAARALRRTMTDAEQLLWSCLRRRQLGGFRFRRQHPVDQFVVDFYCSKVKLAIELDGAQHNEPNGKVRDEERTMLLACHGIQVIRFWNNQVINELDDVLQRIYDTLTERATLNMPPP